jgi:hypothetical protein
MSDPFEVLADEMERALAEVTGRAPPKIMSIRSDRKITSWNALQEDEAGYVLMLDADGEGDHHVSVQDLVAFAHANSVSFDQFVKFKRLN